MKDKKTEEEIRNQAKKQKKRKKEEEREGNGELFAQVEAAPPLLPRARPLRDGRGRFFFLYLLF
jgi:hypothetical protein